MAIADRVRAAVEHMQQKDYESAFLAVSAAVDATAKKCFKKGGRRSYKAFLHDNLSLITKVSLGSTVENMHIAYTHPELVKAGVLNADGLCSIEDLLYHVIRCCLSHEAGLPPDLQLVEQNIIAAQADGTLVLPASFVYGLLAAVVVCSENSDERIGRLEPGFRFGAPIDKMWGKRQKLLDFYSAMDALLA